ncbi:MAG: D-alanine--D-alanine ligase A [Azospira oryzae]|jgi:D-alanine-D-alanine ligase|nr:D-alanine--D-alanine ligase A [Cytophaga sp.]PZR36726.1 MAG: D-alanine--D-alanine ligase A [Azospira oryzae]
MSKIKIAILYGGRSVEHGVSINSAKNIYEYIDKEKYEAYPIGISKKGTWFLTTSVDKEIEKGKPLTLLLNPEKPLFTTDDGKKIQVDVVFPVLHGTDGEDGSIQGLLKAMELPLVGTGVLGSAMSMSKLITKRLLKEAGIPVTKFMAATFDEKDKLNFAALEKEFGLPFMVKAASLGSSVGVSKVKNEADFKTAMDDAFRYDNGVLIEEYVKGREIECAILGNNPPAASLPGEIIISPKYEFYTFDAKYVDGDAVKIAVPAELPATIVEEIRTLSIKTYQALHCEDFSRIDLFLSESGKVYVNEINTIPGFTNSSMYPMMWKERGVSFTELITKLIALSLERFDRSKRIEREFQSSLTF